MKKVIALLMAVLMFVGLFAGCGGGGDDGSEQITLRWMIGWQEQQDTAKVMEVFNEKLQAVLPNTKVEVFSCDDAAFALKMAAKESIDIAWTGFSHDMATEIANGYFLALDDLIEDYAPAIKKERELFEAEYASAVVNGELFALPIQQPIVHQTAFLRIPAKFEKYFDGDAFLKECHENYFTTEKVYQIMDDYFMALKENGVLDTLGFYTRDIFQSIGLRGYDYVESAESGAWLVYDAHAEDPEIVSVIETDAFKLFCKYAAKWYKEGIIPADILTSGDSAPADTVLFAKASSSENWFGVNEEKGIRYEYDENGEILYKTYLCDDEDNLFSGSTIVGSMKTYNAILFTAKNPERAMKFLDILRTDSKETNELVNILCYGIEGEHYTLEEKEDGDHIAHGNGYTVQATGSNLYGVPHWKVTNAFIPYRTPNILDGQSDLAMEYLTKTVPEKVYKTKLYTFQPTLSDQYSYEISQLSQVIGEYIEILYDGVMGDKWEETYKELISKAKAAKLDDIVKVANERADKFIAENK